MKGTVVTRNPMLADPSYSGFSDSLRKNVAPVLVKTLRAEQQRAVAISIAIIIGLPTLVVLYVLSAVGS